MSDPLGLGIFRRPLDHAGPAGTTLVVTQRPLHRVLAHLSYTIDDVVNDRIAKNAVLGYFKVSRQVTRRCEIVDLERQWNPL
jgi:hypothetical protein